MSNILEINNFPFNDILLKAPRPVQGGTYYSKLVTNNGEPILIQTPKCLTKNGIHKTGKKIYCDLKFDIDNDIFIDWFMELEKKLEI